MAALLLGSSSEMNAPAPGKASRWHEVLLGRSLAACVHPVAAWRSRAPSFRVLLLAGYFTIGYVAVLAAMVMGN